MNEFVRAFGRALASTLHPRVLWLTFVPFLIASAGWGLFFWFTWQDLVGTARGWLAGSTLSTAFYRAFDWVGLANLHAVIAPAIVVALSIPLIVATVLLLIATLSMPMVVRHLAARRFATLEARRGGTWYGSLAYGMATTLIGLVLILVTLPLFVLMLPLLLIPPLAALISPLFALIPTLLWGWLTYRVMTYDALALHASRTERIALMRRHRWPLFAIGVASGLMSTLPTLLWVWSLWLVVLFPVIAAVTIWMYAFILVFSALWFGHYCLTALQAMRQGEGAPIAAAPPVLPAA